MELQNTWKKEYEILTSFCDASGRMGIRSIFDVFMDMASAHAAHLGVSYYDMRKQGCFWVAVRTRVRVTGLPRLGDTIMAVTWPGKPSLAKSDRFYRLERDGETLIEGRTEWAVQDIETGAVRRTDSFGYPLTMTPREERVCAEPFTRFRNMELSPEYLVRKYVVESMDIDVGRHMNNVAYIRMLLTTFSTPELEEMDISEAEISYRQGCYEGEELSIYRHREEDGWFFQVQKENGETAIHARLRFR